MKSNSILTFVFFILFFVLLMLISLFLLLLNEISCLKFIEWKEMSMRMLLLLLRMLDVCFQISIRTVFFAVILIKRVKTKRAKREEYQNEGLVRFRLVSARPTYRFFD